MAFNRNSGTPGSSFCGFRSICHRLLLVVVLHFTLAPAVTELHLLASQHFVFEGQYFVAAAGTVLTRSQLLEGFDSLDIDGPAASMMLEVIPAKRDVLKTGGGRDHRLRRDDHRGRTG